LKVENLAYTRVKESWSYG